MIKTFTESKYDLLLLNRELPQLVDKSAVLTGPYMAALTIDNRLHGVIYAFETTSIDSNMFERYGITHVVANKADWGVAGQQFPALASVSPMAEFLVQNQAVGVYRLPEADIPMSDFEHGVSLLRQNDVVPAFKLLSRFYSTHPNSITGAINLALAQLATNRFADADRLLRNATSRHPDSYMLHAQSQYIYESLYQFTQDPNFLSQARRHAARAAQLGLPTKSILQTDENK
jgi:hypothetical protein